MPPPIENTSTNNADVFGEADAAVMSLDPHEIHDLRLLQVCPEEGSRLLQTIRRFIPRALQRQPQGDEGYQAALTYFSQLCAAAAATHGFSTDLATKAHDLMVVDWQTHVISVLGRSLRSASRLVGVIDDLIECAELDPGEQPPPVTKLALHNALSMIECSAPPVGGTVPDANLNEDRQPLPTISLQQESPSQSRSGPLQELSLQGHSTAQTNASSAGEYSSRAHSRQSQDAQMVDVFEQTPSSSQAVDPSADRTKRQPRFKDAEKFFLHHALKAKKARLPAGSMSGSERKAARQEAKVEWTRLDMRTISDWTELFESWKQGDEAALNPSKTAHLFKDGVAFCVWSSAGTSSPVAEPSRSGHRKSAPTSSSHSANMSSNIPKAHATPPARVVRYWTPPKIEDITFLAFDSRKSLQESQLIKNCQAALKRQTHGNANVVHMGARVHAKDGIFTIRWRDTKAARTFLGTTIRYRSDSVRPQAFPRQAPQIFVAHMNHLYDTAIPVESVHGYVAAAVPDIPFHLRHEPIESSRDTAWLVVFQEAPQLLRFTVPMKHKAGGFRNVAFEPVMRDAPCPVCAMSHSAPDCDCLFKAGRVELNVGKRDPRYLGKVPVVTA